MINKWGLNKEIIPIISHSDIKVKFIHFNTLPHVWVEHIA